MTKLTGYSLQITGLIIFFVLLLYPVTYNLKPTYAQVDNCGTATIERAQGLVTAPNLSGRFNTSGGCIVDSKIVIPFGIPTYEDLETTYFEQSKKPKNFIDTEAAPTTFSEDGIYKRAGNLIVSNSITGRGTVVIFVSGKLTINRNIIYHTSDGAGGIVFVVKGSVVDGVSDIPGIIIAPNVTQIDAVLISDGTIYTAGENCQTSTGDTSGQTTTPLVINGSVISLNPNLQARFCRKLPNNYTAAETINTQFKYLVTLRDLFAGTLQKWSEVRADIPIPDILLSAPGSGSHPDPTPDSDSEPTPAATPVATPLPNLLANPGFESSLDNWICQGAAPTPPTAGSSGTCNAISTVKHSGATGAYVNNDQAGSWGQQLLQTEISTTFGSAEVFCLSGYVRYSSSSIGAIAIQEPVGLRRQVKIISPGATGWNFLEQTVVKPSNWVGNTINLYLRNETNGSNVYFDDISLTREACE